MSDTALSIADNLGVESKHIQQNIENKLPEKIASVIASTCGYDYERKKALIQSITSGNFDSLKSTNISQDTLGNLIKGKYVEIVGNLKFDIPIIKDNQYASIHLFTFLTCL
jgi:hypothetical protein